MILPPHLTITNKIENNTVPHVLNSMISLSLSLFCQLTHTQEDESGMIVHTLQFLTKTRKTYDLNEEKSTNE